MRRAPGLRATVLLGLAVAAADLSAVALLAYALSPALPEGALLHALPGVVALLAGSTLAAAWEGEGWGPRAWGLLTGVEAVGATAVLAWAGRPVAALLLLAVLAREAWRRP